MSYPVPSPTLPEATPTPTVGLTELPATGSMEMDVALWLAVGLLGLGFIVFSAARARIKSRV